LDLALFEQSIPPPAWNQVFQLLAKPTMQCHPLEKICAAPVGCMNSAGDMTPQSYES